MEDMGGELRFTLADVVPWVAITALAFSLWYIAADDKDSGAQQVPARKQVAAKGRYRVVSVDKVVDGDTVDCTWELGCDVLLRGRVRLWGINAPEVHGKTRTSGLKSTDALAKLIKGRADLSVEIRGKGKYGRWLGVFYAGDTNVNEWMVDNGYAVEYMRK